MQLTCPLLWKGSLDIGTTGTLGISLKCQKPDLFTSHHLAYNYNMSEVGTNFFITWSSQHDKPSM